MTKIKLYLILLFNISLVFNSLILSQNLFLYGTVIDKNNGKPIKNVNIYLANTQIGTTTNKQGYFELHNLPQGTFSIIFSHVSYEFTTREVHLIHKFNDLGITKLSLKVYELGTVFVTSNDAKLWKERFQNFRDNFIGIGKNSDSTFIKNPYKIEFSEKNDKIFANSKDPIIIINKSLGYKIIYFLKDFETCNKFTKYSGNAIFLPLPPVSKKDSSTWLKNRKETYKGSLRNFLDVLNSGYTKFVFGHKSYKLTDGYSRDIRYFKCDAFLNSNGFLIYRVSHLSWMDFGHVFGTPISTKGLLSEGKIKSERYLKFSDFLRIYYLPDYNTKAYPANYNLRNVINIQSSYLELTKDSVMVDIHGRYFNKFGIHTFGKFGLERISDLLPYEYEYKK